MFGLGVSTLIMTGAIADTTVIRVHSCVKGEKKQPKDIFHVGDSLNHLLFALFFIDV